MNDLGPIPRLESQRLLLRPFCLYDATQYCKLAFDPDILITTDMPHETNDNATREWIMAHPSAWRDRHELFLLITLKENRQMLGAISLFTYMRHKKADLGYWITKNAWGNGFAFEAAQTVVNFAFNTMNLNKLEANHMPSNPKSANVLKKLGFSYEGLMRQTYLKGDSFIDLMFYGLLKSEYSQNNL